LANWIAGANVFGLWLTAAVSIDARARDDRCVRFGGEGARTLLSRFVG
jgi:hypothetical protein